MDFSQCKTKGDAIWQYVGIMERHAEEAYRLLRQGRQRETRKQLSIMQGLIYKFNSLPWHEPSSPHHNQSGGLPAGDKD